MKKTWRIIRLGVRAVLLIAFGGLLLYNGYIFVMRYFFGQGMPTVFGFSAATVVSGSMADEINEGHFIITKEQSAYREGDIITFFDNESKAYITHRIILVSGDTYATKGDANDAPDAFSVPKEAVIGKVVTVWKGFGKAVTFLQSPGGLFCVACSGVFLWIIWDIITGWVEKEKNERKED